MVMPWIRVAMNCLGQKEYPGAANNPVIMNWARRVGRFLGIAYAGDHVPWCGLFAGFCVTEAGLTPPPIAVRASAWASWGVPLKSPVPGAVLVFTREGGGHVGFFVGHDATTYHVLGGNQGDAVSVTRIAKDRCTAIRWPSGVPVKGVTPAFAVFNGKISTNEA